MRKVSALLMAVVCTVALVWLLVTPGTAEDRPGSSAKFSVAGDGQLPTSRPALRDARDPLSVEETGYAIDIATRDPELAAGAMNVRGEAGWEMLAVDIPDDDVDNKSRRAVVTLYDYASDTTVVQLVDLSKGRVTKSRSVGRLQRPPSADETNAAVTIALAANPPLTFRADFEASEGVPLVSPKQISAVAGVWTHDGVARAGDECGKQRCVRLIVATTAGRYLDTTDFVVNLSRRDIVRLGGER